MPNELLFSVLKTLSYADVFDFPMNFDELWKFLISKKPIAKKELTKIVLENKNFIKKEGNYYFLSDRKLVTERKKRTKYCKDKMEKARLTASILSCIPWIKLVGVSGSLAVSNSKKNDDIDFFIITEKERLWITRFLVSIILIFMGHLRKRNSANTKDKICPNFYLSFANLEIEKERQNLFTAHELVQLKVLMDKRGSYRKFLASNLWALDFLPNSIDVKMLKTISAGNIKSLENSKFEKLFVLIEKLFFKMQLFYMKRHITSETIGLNIAKFHPDDQKEKVLDLYVKNYNFYKKNLLKKNENSWKLKHKNRGYYGLLTY